MQISKRSNVRRRLNRSGLSGVLLLTWLAGGCSHDPAAKADVVATIDGDPVTMSDLEARIGERLSTLEYEYRKQRYELLESALQDAVRDHLVERAAAARGITADELIASEVDSQAKVSEEEIHAWYEQNKSALGGRSLDELSEPIGRYLRDNRRERALKALTDSLRQGTDVVVLLEPFRVELNNEGSPTLGPEDAPVTLVEFSDFECPYCGRFYRTLKQLREAYADELRVVYRQFPINTHPNAYRAAQASLCAHEQGRFWEMHDAMFEDQDHLDAEPLNEKAERIGLDMEQFAGCLESGRHDEQIERDMREAQRLGVTGTPAIFVNGIPLAVGAPAYSVAARAIDEELSRAGS
ncbi:MAG: DsbA family protein [Gemmatimonadales bacterium]|jgi:protein-disulfide isomerase